MIWDDTRADWGAAPSGSMHSAPPATRTEFFNHFDGGHLLGLLDADDDGDVDADDHVACLRRVKSVQTFHQGPSRGWSDIGYNGLVCQHGRAIEGRGLDYVGAHCPDHNRTGYGIQFMVGGDEEPTQAAKNRMRRLYDDCSARSGRPLAKRGHRDGLSTECPGDVVYAWVRAGMPASSEATFDLGTATGPGDVWQPSGQWTTKDVQQLVGVTADGIYGPGTIAAVKELQTALDLKADGLWGPTTEGVIVTIQSDITSIQTDLKRVLTAQGNLERQVAKVDRFTRMGVNVARYEGPGKVIDRLTPVVVASGNVDVTELKTAIVADLREDVVQAIKDAGSGALVDDILDALAERITKAQP